MSKLSEMIATLCPNGVEYKKIKDVYTRLRGTPITATQMKEIGRKGAVPHLIISGPLGDRIVILPPLALQSDYGVAVVDLDLPEARCLPVHGEDGLDPELHVSVLVPLEYIPHQDEVVVIGILRETDGDVVVECPVSVFGILVGIPLEIRIRDEYCRVLDYEMRPDEQFEIHPAILGTNVRILSLEPD